MRTMVAAGAAAGIGWHLPAEGSLQSAMKIFGRKDVSEIPVLEGRKFLGVIKRKDVIEAYNHEILKKEAAAGLVAKTDSILRLRKGEGKHAFSFPHPGSP